MQVYVLDWQKPKREHMEMSLMIDFLLTLAFATGAGWFDWGGTHMRF